MPRLSTHNYTLNYSEEHIASEKQKPILCACSRGNESERREITTQYDYKCETKVTRQNLSQTQKYRQSRNTHFQKYMHMCATSSDIKWIPTVTGHETSLLIQEVKTAKKAGNTEENKVGLRIRGPCRGVAGMYILVFQKLNFLQKIFPMKILTTNKFQTYYLSLHRDILFILEAFVPFISCKLVVTSSLDHV